MLILFVILAYSVYTREIPFSKGQAILLFNSSRNQIYSITADFGQPVNMYPVTYRNKETPLPTFSPNSNGTAKVGVMGIQMTAYLRNNMRAASSNRLEIDYPGNYYMTGFLPPYIKFDSALSNVTILLDNSDQAGFGALIVVLEDDVGNTMSTAFPLILEGTEPERFMEFAGRLDSGSDSDYFMVGFIDNSTNPQAKTLYFWTDAQDGVHTDTVGTLYDYDGNQLAHDDDSNGDGQFLFQFTLQPNTPYFVNVAASVSYAGGIYTFRYAYVTSSKASVFSRMDIYATEVAETTFPRYTKQCSGACPTQIGNALVMQYCFPMESCLNPFPSVVQPCNEVCRGVNRTTSVYSPTTMTTPDQIVVHHTRAFDNSVRATQVAGIDAKSFGLIIALFVVIGVVIGFVIYYRSGAHLDDKQGLYALPPEATFLPATQHTMLNGQSVYGGGMDGSTGMSVYGGGMNPAMMNMSVMGAMMNPAMMNMSVYGGANPASMNMSVYGAANPTAMNMSVYGAPMNVSVYGAPMQSPSTPANKEDENLIEKN